MHSRLRRPCPASTCPHALLTIRRPRPADPRGVGLHPGHHLPGHRSPVPPAGQELHAARQGGRQRRRPLGARGLPPARDDFPWLPRLVPPRRPPGADPRAGAGHPAQGRPRLGECVGGEGCGVCVQPWDGDVQKVLLLLLLLWATRPPRSPLPLTHTPETDLQRQQAVSTACPLPPGCAAHPARLCTQGGASPSTLPPTGAPPPPPPPLLPQEWEYLLEELSLYFLMYSEGANLRHTPEVLWFLFWCLRNSHDKQLQITVPPPSDPRSAAHIGGFGSVGRGPGGAA